MEDFKQSKEISSTSGLEVDYGFNFDYQTQFDQ